MRGEVLYDLDGGVEMSISNSKKSDSLSRVVISNIVLNEACKIQNGSIKIIKQDNIVIQINVNEKIILDNQVQKENFVEEAVL